MPCDKCIKSSTISGLPRDSQWKKGSSIPDHCIITRNTNNGLCTQLDSSIKKALFFTVLVIK